MKMCYGPIPRALWDEMRKEHPSVRLPRDVQLVGFDEASYRNTVMIRLGGEGLPAWCLIDETSEWTPLALFDISPDLNHGTMLELAIEDATRFGELR